MPFDDNAFDFVFSHAVIEHVGNFDNQLQFIRECIRVSKKYVFITTPNRFYPMELHTYLPFLHWLPKRMYRKLITRLGKPFFASEDNLNLLSKSDLREFRNKLCGEMPDIEFEIKHIRFLGFVSNLFVVVEKPGA